MLIGIPKEAQDSQTLVASTPDTVGKLIKLGYEVCVETGAGLKASFLDQQYVDVGAHIVEREMIFRADIVIAVDNLPSEELRQLKPGALFIARMGPAQNPELIQQLVEQKVTGFAMDTVPRISRAQSMDVLSSMANVSGYRAVIEAAQVFGRLFTGQVTAAGKMPPAKVYVIGVGVAGLSAIGTANAMGAQVYATDVRSETAEQAESVGAKFVPVPIQQEKSEDGYAKPLTEAQLKVAEQLYAKQAAESDIVITTANIPGRKAPVLITKEAVAKMKPGSVIVDMAAGNGGNCELTVPNKRVRTENGVIILGITDLAARLPGQSSQLYGQNIVNLFRLITPEKDGCYLLDIEDQIIRGIIVSLNGENMYPPPPIKVAATPTSTPMEVKSKLEEATEKAQKKNQQLKSKQRKTFLGGILATLLGVSLLMSTPMALLPYYFILMLAIVVGFYVITSVTHSLHTPLMSETNAISGIIMVGAILQIGSSNIVVVVLSFIALLVASINIFGGFAVTNRMLTMFKKEDR